MRKKSANAVNVELARLAANQHGRVSTAQMRRLGLSEAGITRRVQAGRLHRVHRGVYALGHTSDTDEARWMGAVLACGDDAALSHRAAAGLWKLLQPPTGPVDVTVPGSGGRKPRRGIRIHRSNTLTQQAVTRRANIPATTPARTLLDLHGCVPPVQLGRARRQAEVLGYPLGDAAAIEPDHTRSDLERRFLRLCQRHRLPSPEVNARVGDHVVDFLWRHARLIVETDGYRYHAGRAAFEHDRARDASLAAAGHEALRFSWRQIDRAPDVVIAALRARMTPTLT